MMRRFILCWLVLGLALPFLLHATSVRGQQAAPATEDEGEPQGFDLFDILNASDAATAFGGTGGEELVLSGQLKLQRGGRNGVLDIQAVLQPDWHTYAVDQEGGPGPSRITIKSTGVLELLGPFQPDRPPKVRKVDVFDVPLREHYGRVVWSAPVRLADEVNPEEARIEVQFDGQICDDRVGCRPMFGEIVPVRFAGYYQPTAAPTTARAAPAADAMPSLNGGYRAAKSHATIRGYVQPSCVAPGDSFRVVLVVESDPGYHVYAYAERDAGGAFKPTLISMLEPDWPVAAAPSPSSAPIEKQFLAGEAPVRYHAGSVRWTLPMRVPKDVAAGDYRVTGRIGYQSCTDNGCDRPTAAQFSATVTVGNTADDRQQALAFAAARYADVARSARSTQPSPATAAAADDTAPAGATRYKDVKLGIALLYAFLGGLILNIMPCVLPVIGLKILSFVQQAGESRLRVFALNVWYALGLLSVFLALATLLAIWNVGWGEQFTDDRFTITMTAIVFAMGLSFLGVWEIPIPGFVGGAKASQMAEKEGPAGAFLKGAITTVLATPCSGPGIAIALGYCNGKPPAVVYLIFAMLGLGMASPYLIIGANPKLARFLPKPGMWMETFKQIMGLVLMGTVIYLLSFMTWVNVLPTVALLLALGGAFWWIGRTPATAPAHVRLRAWLAATVFACLLGVYAFSGKATLAGYQLTGLRGTMEHRLAKYVARQAATLDQTADVLASPEIVRHDREIHWVPFTETRLDRLVADNRTTLVDFTADWCLTCKTLEATVLNTAEVRSLLTQNGVVTLMADWTHRDPEISRMLESLGSKQVPVVAIFPAGRAKDPIVLAGFYTRETLLAKLRQAGPSRRQADDPA